eukprot:CAMPEP_0198601696 /NCGR_PEP_ID=MMETSP1462-20131121/149851_1 /TAXON_ID=1333877 /ORGANISM="Brandtodinium nutriculum, Strain RCC3387" /LENGTH=59 /DNA_ID=CAMNT_0044333433 /DNA_START=11 /DNA_END=190 /DNA_ORIENTATION=+
MGLTQDAQQMLRNQGGGEVELGLVAMRGQCATWDVCLGHGCDGGRFALTEHEAQLFGEV